LGPAPTGTGTIALHPNFWKKFYRIRTSFIPGEPVFLVKVFRLFRLEMDCVGVQSLQHHLIDWQGQRVCDALFKLHCSKHLSIQLTRT